MIEYNNKKIFFEGKELDFQGLNTSHIIWHLQEMHKPERFLSYYGAKRVMPTRIHAMTLAEGVDFDALLIDNNMFRYQKLSEADRNEVQEYINKSAFATALLKLNECSQVIGSGLEHDFNESEMYKYLSSSYDKLFENTYVTNERGRLVESFGSDSKIGIYEGENLYIRGTGDKRVAEDWSNHFSYDKLNEYHFDSVKQDCDCTIAKFITKEGQIYEAWFLGSNAKLVEAGINLKHFLRKADLLESFRIGTLVEYHQPFTIKDAVLITYDVDGDKVKLGMLDAYRNRGVVEARLNISVDEFKKKYDKQISEILDAQTFDERLDLTSEFLEDAEEDFASLSRIKGRQIVQDDDDNNSALSYKVKGYTPVQEEGSETVFVDRKDKTKFKVLVVDSDGKPYNITYKYTGEEPIRDAVEMINAEADEYDFTVKSEVISFYRMLNDYGIPQGSYPRGNSTAGRNYHKKEEGEIMETGVQVGDIAPKVDQGQMISVKMKRKKKVEESIEFDKNDLLINTLNEKDEFYGARGFIKDEKGRYHFNDYYVTESGKVVHKSKLVESDFEKWKEENSDKIASYYTSTYSKDLKNINQKVWDSLAKDLYDEEKEPTKINKVSSKLNEYSIDIVPDEYAMITSEDEKYDVFSMYYKHNKYYDLLVPKNWNEEKYRMLGLKIARSKGPVNNRDLVKEVEQEYSEKYKDNRKLNEDSYVPKYRCVSAGYETISTFDSKEEAISFAKENKQVYSVVVDYYTDGKLVSIGTRDIWCRYDESNLTEDQAAADAIYYKANDAEKILFELKKMLTDETLIKVLEDVIITLNNIRMEGYKQALNETKIADAVAQDGIRTYFDILFDEKPQSQYDKMLKQAIELHDNAEDLFKENPEEARKLRLQAAELMYKADMIPEENRGPLYAEFMEIDKANHDEFAQSRGYKTFDDLVAAGLVESSVDDKLVKQGKCPYCTGPITDEEYKLFGMCGECWDNGVE